MDKLVGFSGFEKAMGTLAEFTLRLAKKHNLKIAFAGKRPKFVFEKGGLINTYASEGSVKKLSEHYLNEYTFYNKYIKGNYKILERNADIYSSYQLMSNSKLTIAMCSTLLRENLALRGKVLACNFTNNKIWNFPIQGICSLNNLNFEKFEKRVLKLLSISYRNYILNLKKKPKYVMYFSKSNSTLDLLKKRIKSFMV